MANIIVAFSRTEDARNIKNNLMKNGFPVNSVCQSGAQALALMEDLGSGIIVCGYRLADMISTELAENMEPGFTMLMIASPSRWPPQTPENVILLPIPLKVRDLVDTVDMIDQTQARRRRRERARPKVRDPEEQKILDEAKGILMERNGMTEEEAHRYIQKCSMDSGVNMTETAQMIISMTNI